MGLVEQRFDHDAESKLGKLGVAIIAVQKNIAIISQLLYQGVTRVLAYHVELKARDRVSNGIPNVVEKPCETGHILFITQIANIANAHSRC